MNKISKTAEKVILIVTLFILLMIPPVTHIIRKGSESDVQQKEIEEEQKAEVINEKDLLDTSDVIYIDTVTRTGDVFTKIYSVHKDGSVALAKHYNLNYERDSTVFVYNVNHKPVAYSDDIKVWRCFDLFAETFLRNMAYYANGITFNPNSCINIELKKE